MKTMKNLMLLIAIAMITITAPSCKKVTPVEPQNAKVVQQQTWKEKYALYFSNQTWTAQNNGSGGVVVGSKYNFGDMSGFINNTATPIAGASYALKDANGDIMSANLPLLVDGVNVGSFFCWDEVQMSSWHNYFGFAFGSVYYGIVTVNDSVLIVQQDNVTTNPQLKFTK